MAAKSTESMGLSPRQLNEVDTALLDYLREGRATPRVLNQWIVDDGLRDELSTGYVNQRLRRLEEHDHLRNLGGGLYELVDDPRGDTPSSEGVDVDELLDALADARDAYENVNGDGIEDALDRMEEILDGE